jgi:hypothetical protein
VSGHPLFCRFVDPELCEIARNILNEKSSDIYHFTALGISRLCTVWIPLYEVSRFVMSWYLAPIQCFKKRRILRLSKPCEIMIKMRDIHN